MRWALLLGDSIRLGYQPAVMAALPGWRVAGPEENCRSSRDLAASLAAHLATLHEPAVVHVNAGLHDVRRRPETAWRPLVALAEYATNLDAIVATLAAHPLVGASGTIVATTTPVDDERHNARSESHRCCADVIAYNEVMRRVAARHGVALHDLFAFVAGAGSDLLSGDGVHLTPDGSVRVGRRVAAVILAHAGGAAQPRSNSNHTGW